MRVNLQVAYLSLLSVTCISSLFLFFVVFTENAKYTAAATASAANAEAENVAVGGGEETIPFQTAASDNVRPVPTAAPPAVPVEVLSKYKKVKDVKSVEDKSFLAAAAATELDGIGSVVQEAKFRSSADVKSASSDDDALLPRRNADESTAQIIINDKQNEPEQHGNAENSKTDSAPVKYAHRTQKDGEEKEAEEQKNLPDITEIPTITVTELPFEILEPTGANLDALIIDAAKETIAREHENHTLEILANNSEDMINKDETIIKFDDSGGSEQPQLTLFDAAPNLSAIPQNIPNVNNDTSATAATTTPTTTTQITSMQNESASPTPAASVAATTGSASSLSKDELDEKSGSARGETVNLTVEEVPIPVFSEWAQKQMEAAEKQQAKEQEVVNTATQKKNHTNGDGKRVAPLKMRNKNYASPDCGAKIIASNADATNTGAVLSSSKDEYMLSPCGNRIWFVVELCEAIQAQKVELANFELFSSSPKNFTVAVSNRFPTRDWSNVGRFIAEDKRNVQSFDLHPHLFGKFVRVDIHSHYSKEHFCPVSLFRVFGTSEFEAFETENGNTPHADLDDFDDEFGQEPVHAKSTDTNLFKSASDAVLSIVKKAAEVLAKPPIPLNMTFTRSEKPEIQCCTPASGHYSCMDCDQPLVARINTVLSCEYPQLQSLLKVPWLLKDLARTQICAKEYGIEMRAKIASDSCTAPKPHTDHAMEMHVKQSYYINMLPSEYVGALCQLLATQNARKSITAHHTHDGKEATEPPLNLTIEKKLKKKQKQKKKDEFKIIDKKLVQPHTAYIADGIANNAGLEASGSGDSAPEIFVASATTKTTTTENVAASEVEQLMQQPQVDFEHSQETTTTTRTDSQHKNEEEGGDKPQPTLDVNIFNVPAHVEQTQQQEKDGMLAKAESEIPREELMSSGDGGYTTTESVVITTTPLPPSSNLDTQRMSVVDGGSTSEDDTIQQLQPTPAIKMQSPSLAARSEEDNVSWENIDNLITSSAAPPTADGGGSSNEAGTQAATNQPGMNLQHKIPSGPQSESVFMRLSNRIKALERNMSLSGQYLEELSRRYKKQVEELQLTLTQTVQTLRTLEDQSRRQSELHHMLAQRNIQLKDELDDLSLQVHACIVVIIFVGAFVFLVLLVSILFYRSMRRETKEVLALYTTANNKKNKTTNAAAVAAMQKKLNRRKSYEDYSDYQQSGGGGGGGGEEILRRPSEEALMILKEHSSSRDRRVYIETVGDATPAKSSQRERKISVCYSNNNAAATAANAAGGVQSVRQRRKGEKHSWPNTEHAQQQARRHLAQLQRQTANDAVASDMAQSAAAAAVKLNGRPPRVPQVSGSGSESKVAGNKPNKRKSLQPRRQASMPNELIMASDDGTAATTDASSAAEYDESLRLEEDDLDNFLPTSDLAYNEFMPGGPSGYQVEELEDYENEGNGTNAESKKTGKMLSRLSAPAFFKSPFGKSRNKLRGNKSVKHADESTSWEWYRLKNAEAKPLSGSASASGGFMRASPTTSMDTSSLSEILLPNSRTENSFRILEEAILSSGEKVATAAGDVATNATNNAGHGGVNGNGQSNGNSYSNGSQHSNASSMNSNSNRSSTSSASTKKKNRSFNKIFRNVF